MNEIQDPSLKILEQIAIPIHFPEINYPDLNDYSPDRWSLGKKLSQRRNE